MRRWIAITGLTVAIIVVKVVTDRTPTRAQADPQSQFQQVADDISAGNASLAIPILQSLSQTNPGSDIDGQAQLTLAFVYARPLKNLAQARLTYQAISQQFHNAVWGFLADANLLDTQLLVDGIPFANYLQGLNADIVRAGGPSLEQTRAGARGLIQPVAFLTSDQQHQLLAWLYLLAAGRMSDQAQTQSGKQLLQQAINIQVFVLDNDPTSDLGSDASQTLRNDILTLNGQRGAANAFPQDTTAPKIYKVAPEHESGPRPDVEARMDDGNISQSQINPQSIQLVVDGADVTKQTVVSTQVSRSMKVRSGQIFEKVKLRYRPPTNLPPGTHSATLKVSDQAGNPSQRTWSWSVMGSRDRDGDHDGSDDESRCDREPSDDED